MVMAAAYPSYRASGLSWAPTVPKDWQVLRNGRLFGHRVETGFPDLPILEVSLRSGVRVRDMENLKRKQMMSQKEKYKRAVKDDLAYNMMRMWQGAVGPAPVDGLVSPAYVVVKPYPEANSHYFSYLFRTAAYMQEVNKYSRGIVTDRNRLYWESFKQMPSLVPPRSEQDQIVAYLRVQDAHIARFIKAKRDLIALLTEQKLRIIDHAVTHGLDASVALKPSGVEWLGDVPESWTMLPLKRLVKPKISDGPHESPNFVDDGVPFVSAEAVFNGRINLEKRRADISREDHERYCLKVRPQRNDIFVVKSGSTTGKCCIVDFDEEFSIWSPLALVRANQKANSQFLFFALCSSYFQKQVQEKWSFGTQPNIGMGVLENLRVATPTISEQGEISKLISTECKPLDEAIAKAEEEIKLIREYRDRLIADVVTGQVDVRGWQPGPDDAMSDEALAALGDDDEGVSDEEDDDGDE